MKNTLVLFLLSFTVACAQKETTPVDPIFSAYDPSIPVLNVSMYHSNFDHDVVKEHPYDAEFSIETSEDGQYRLITDIKLHGGSFFVSPHSAIDFKGKFRVDLIPNDFISLGENFVETPQSREVIDKHQFVNGPVNWVTKDTRYDHPLTINSEEDFEIGGQLTFVIEPKCTLEEIPVIFKYENGVLTVKPSGC